MKDSLFSLSIGIVVAVVAFLLGIIAHLARKPFDLYEDRQGKLECEVSKLGEEIDKLKDSITADLKRMYELIAMSKRGD